MRYQGICLLNEPGSNTMSYYDQLPPEVRMQLRNSSENLCPACIRKFAYGSVVLDGAVERMEQAVRKIRDQKPSF